MNLTCIAMISFAAMALANCEVAPVVQGSPDRTFVVDGTEREMSDRESGSFVEIAMGNGFSGRVVYRIFADGDLLIERSGPGGGVETVEQRSSTPAVFEAALAAARTGIETADPQENQRCLDGMLRSVTISDGTRVVAERRAMCRDLALDAILHDVETALGLAPLDPFATTRAP